MRFTPFYLLEIIPCYRQPLWHVTPFVGSIGLSLRAPWTSDQLIEEVRESESLSSRPNQRPRTTETIDIERSPSSDELIKLRAQKKALLKSQRNNELAQFTKDVAELLKGSKSAIDNDDDDEGTDPRLTPLKAQLSAVKVNYIRQILNTFAQLNISRLCNDVTIFRGFQSRYIDLGKNIEVKMKEDNASELDIKGPAVLMRGLLVNFQIQLHFVEHNKVRLLGAAYSSYQGRLCRHYSIYTWESVRSFHIHSHQTAINERIRDPFYLIQNRHHLWKKIPSSPKEINHPMAQTLPKSVSATIKINPVLEDATYRPQLSAMQWKPPFQKLAQSTLFQ